MEEANERIVKLFLEMKGFFVKTNEKIHVDKNINLEADIIAIRLVKREDGIPNKLIGEVKGWPLDPKHFKKLNPRTKKEHKSFKYLNNTKYKKKFIRQVEKKYGKGFKFAIFAKPHKKNSKNILNNFFKKEKIFFIDHITILNTMIKEIKEGGYSNDPELQVLRLMKKYKLLKKEE